MHIEFHLHSTSAGVPHAADQQNGEQKWISMYVDSDVVTRRLQYIPMKSNLQVISDIHSVHHYQQVMLVCKY